MKKLLILPLFLICLSLFAGTESGGGGGTIVVDSKQVLIDFFTITKHVNELPKFKGAPSRIKTDTQENPFFLQSSDQAVIQLRKTLDNWGEYLDVILIDLRVNLKRDIAWKIVDKRITVPPFYVSPIIQNEYVTVSAAYKISSENQGYVQIDRNTWNNMDLLSQTGLLLHEVLRQVQIGYNVEHKFNDESLQKVTAIYLLCTPSTSLNEIISTYLSESRATKNESFDSMIRRECKKVQ